MTMEELRVKVTRTQKMQLIKKLKEYDIVWETNPHVINDTLEFVLEQINMSQRFELCSSNDDKMVMLASFFPPPGVESTEMPQQIVEAIEGCLAIYAPERERKTAAAAGSAGMQAIHLTTAEEKEKEQRQRMIGGIRIPRNTPPPWSAVYPALWCEMMLKTGIDTAFVAWERTIDHLFHGLTIPEHMRPRFRHLVAATRDWLLIAEGLMKAMPGDVTVQKTLEKKVDDLPAHVVKLWFHLTEQMVELMLLSGVRLAGTPTTATTKFNSSMLQKWTSTELVDVYRAFSDAVDAKDPPSQKPPIFRMPHKKQH